MVCLNLVCDASPWFDNKMTVMNNETKDLFDDKVVFSLFLLDYKITPNNLKYHFVIALIKFYVFLSIHLFNLGWNSCEVQFGDKLINLSKHFLHILLR